MITAQSAAATEVQAAKGFIAREIGRFARSHSALYCALILDVIHTHGGTQPRGYPASVQLVAPDLPCIGKYCTVINPALSSPHLSTLATFPATADGVSAAVKWLENQTKLAGYTLSLEDIIRFFKGKWSTAAQRAADAEAAKHIQEKRTQSAIESTTQRAVKEAHAKAHREAEQDILSTIVTLPQRGESAPHTTAPGPVVGADWVAHSVTVSTKGDELTITGLDSLSPEHLCKMMEQINERLLAVMDAPAQKVA